MGVAPSEETVAAIVALARSAAAPGAGPKVIGIDGPSGSGKSTLAAPVAERLGATLVPIEPMYQGWDGLEETVALLVRDVLAPLAAGAPAAALPRWDWTASRPLPPEPLDAPATIVLEGVGAGAAAVRPYLAALIWVEAPDDVRRERAFKRDGDTYRPHWERWAAQERVMVQRDRPREHAALIVDSVSGRPLLRP